MVKDVVVTLNVKERKGEKRKRGIYKRQCCDGSSTMQLPLPATQNRLLLPKARPCTSLKWITSINQTNVSAYDLRGSSIYYSVNTKSFAQVLLFLQLSLLNLQFYPRYNISLCFLNLQNIRI